MNTLKPFEKKERKTHYSPQRSEDPGIVEYARMQSYLHAFISYILFQLLKKLSLSNFSRTWAWNVCCMGESAKPVPDLSHHNLNTPLQSLIGGIGGLGLSSAGKQV